MPEIQELELKISKNGEVAVRVAGVKGNKCLQLTRGIEQLLGNDIRQRELTSPFYEEAVVPENQEAEALIGLSRK